MSPSAARVLAALREAGEQGCSGAALSESLGVSRTAVWKQVETLRARGYAIAGEPGGGYRLDGAPDRLYAEELEAALDTRWLGREIRYLESTDSTNRVARELGRDGAAHGTTVIAEGQTAGRGRLGRSFFSPPFLNLYTSIVLRPRLTTAEAPTTILAAGVAVAEAVAAEVADPEAVEIKWPNDVLLDGRKTCGILMEMNAEATQVEFLVLGIGVNLNVDPATFPEEFRASATSVSEWLGRPVDRVAFARRLYGTLEELLEVHGEKGFEGVRSRFQSFFRMPGRRVAVAEPGGDTLEGIALGVDGDGALELRGADGSVVRVVAGDVTVLRGRTGEPR